MTNQTIDGVPRELLEGLLTLAAMSASAPYRELRALLDAPVYPQVKMVKPHKHTCACVTGDSWVCDCGAVVDGLPVPAAQPQGEPVERQPDAIIEGVMTSVGISHAIYASTVTLKHGEQVKLYAEQPAPVAFDFELAAQKLASRMDYPWEYMPEQGRNEMRGHAKAIINAAQVAPVAMALPDRDRLRDLIAQAIGSDTYDCVRVWSAWGVGTMSEDDFVPVVEQEARLYEIADACIVEVARVQGVKP